jgi:hypothetical protein
MGLSPSDVQVNAGSPAHVAKRTVSTEREHAKLENKHIAFLMVFEIAAMIALR